MEITATILINIGSSFIFIYLLLYIMRPRIKISPHICYSLMPLENEKFYIFKIVNTSFFYAYDIEIKLIKKEPYMVNKGKR